MVSQSSDDTVRNWIPANLVASELMYKVTDVLLSINESHKLPVT